MRIRRIWLASTVLFGLVLCSPANLLFAIDPDAVTKADVRSGEIAGAKVLSIRADAVPLGQLLRQFDAATGMTSRVVSKDLETRKVSVRFSNLDYAAAVRKIFQGQPFDYIFIRGQGVVVTASPQAVSGGPVAPPSPSTPAPPVEPIFSASPTLIPPPMTGTPDIRPATDSAPRPLPPNAPLAMPGGGPPGEDMPVLPFAESASPTAPAAAPVLSAVRPVEAAPLGDGEAVQGESSMAKKPKPER